MHFARKLAGSGWVLVVLGALASAAAAEPLADARQFLAAGKPDAAFAVLAPHEPERAGQADFDYLLGIAALDSGRATRAIFALERVLATQPENTLARAEIARAYLAASEPDTARAELEQVQRGHVPEAARDTIDRLLGVIRQSQASQAPQARSYVEASFGHDSNANRATAASQVAIPALGGLQFALDPASRQRSDTYVAVGAGTSLRIPLAPDLAFNANAAVSTQANARYESLEPAVVDVNAGLTRLLGAHALTGAAMATFNWSGGSQWRQATGLAGQWQYNHSAQDQTTAFVQWSHIDYPGNRIRNADRHVLGAGHATQLANGSIAFATLFAGGERPRAGSVDHLGHRVAGARAGIQRDLTGEWTVFANAAFETRHYGASEPLFSISRRDRQTDLNVGLHYRFAPGWRLTPQLALTDNRSGIALYDFRRTAILITARREF